MKKIVVCLFVCLFVCGVKAEDKKGEYKLVVNYFNSPVCEEFLQNLKEFEDKDFMLCDIELSPKYPQFHQLNWMTLDNNAPKIREFMEYVWGFGRDRMKDPFRGFDYLMNGFDSGAYTIRKAKISGIHDGKKSVLLWIEDNECSKYENLGTKTSKLYLLDDSGKKLDMNAFPFSPNERGGSNPGGNPIAYKEQTKIIIARQNGRVYDPDYDIDIPADGSIMLRYLRESGRKQANGEIRDLGVVSSRECLYSWTKNK